MAQVCLPASAVRTSPLTIRLFHLADNVEVFHQHGGADAAVELARCTHAANSSTRRSSTSSVAPPRTCFEGLDDIADVPAEIASDPRLQQRLPSPNSTRHWKRSRTSPICAHAVDPAIRGPSPRWRPAPAQSCGLPRRTWCILRRAALVHDVGMHGVPANILDKPGPLTSTESERMRMHSYYTERTLARPPALARIGAVASMANERLDGSGYHRGLSGSAIPTDGADPRRRRRVPGHDASPAPHRPARSPKEATGELRREVRAGRLAADAVDAVLAAAGQRRPKRATGPAGLTPREIEVLTLISRGASNRQVAQKLGITPKTAGTHIERIYAKIGASTRSTATLFAMQNGLLDSLEPLDL